MWLPRGPLRPLRGSAFGLGQPDAFGAGAFTLLRFAPHTGYICVGLKCFKMRLVAKIGRRPLLSLPKASLYCGWKARSCGAVVRATTLGVSSKLRRGLLRFGSHGEKWGTSNVILACSQSKTMLPYHSWRGDTPSHHERPLQPCPCCSRCSKQAGRFLYTRLGFTKERINTDPYLNQVIRRLQLLAALKEARRPKAVSV